MKGSFTRLVDAFKDWLSRRLPDCREITPTIGESLDRKLGRWERLVMKLHLFTCDRCERYLHHLRFLHRTIRQHGEKIADPEPMAAPEFRTASKDRMKRLLERTMLEGAGI